MNTVNPVLLRSGEMGKNTRLEKIEMVKVCGHYVKIE